MILFFEIFIKIAFIFLSFFCIGFCYCIGIVAADKLISFINKKRSDNNA